MKPRRWYSSPEMNPVRESYRAPFASRKQLMYAARIFPQQGSVMRMVMIERQPYVNRHALEPLVPSGNVVARRIEAA